VTWRPNHKAAQESATSTEEFLARLRRERDANDARIAQQRALQRRFTQNERSYQSSQKSTLDDATPTVANGAERTYSDDALGHSLRERDENAARLEQLRAQQQRFQENERIYQKANLEEAAAKEAQAEAYRKAAGISESAGPKLREPPAPPVRDYTDDFIGRLQREHDENARRVHNLRARQRRAQENERIFRESEGLEDITPAAGDEFVNADEPSWGNDFIGGLRRERAENEARFERLRKMQRQAQKNEHSFRLSENEAEQRRAEERARHVQEDRARRQHEARARQEQEDQDRPQHKARTSARDQRGSAPRTPLNEREAVALELGLTVRMTAKDRSIARRQFAMKNHPDVVPPDQRKAAERRMTIANELFDLASRDDRNTR